jgi:hypothetical protein
MARVFLRIFARQFCLFSYSFFSTMDKQQTARWKRHLKLKQVRQAHAATPVGGLVTRAFGRYDALLQAADDLMTTPTGRSEGATRQKGAEEKRVVAVVLPIANALRLLYLEAQDEQQAQAVRVRKSDYTALAAPLLLAEARNVAKQARANAKALAAEGDLDKADLDELDEAADAFAALLTAPKVAIETGKTTNAALDGALRAADTFVKEMLTPAVETLKRKQPAFYEALRAALRIDDAPSARRSGDTPPAPAKPTDPAA